MHSYCLSAWAPPPQAPTFSLSLAYSYRLQSLMPEHTCLARLCLCWSWWSTNTDCPTKQNNEPAVASRPVAAEVGSCILHAPQLTFSG